MGQAASA